MFEPYTDPSQTEFQNNFNSHEYYEGKSNSNIFSYIFSLLLFFVGGFFILHHINQLHEENSIEIKNALKQKKKEELDNINKNSATVA